MRRSVVFPAPFGPMRPTLSAASRPKVAPARSGLKPNDFETFSSERMFMAKGARTSLPRIRESRESHGSDSRDSRTRSRHPSALDGAHGGLGVAGAGRPGQALGERAQLLVGRLDRGRGRVRPEPP